MFKACRRACALAALGVFMAASSGAANATVLNITDYIDDTDGVGPDTGVGEQAVGADLVIQGVTVSAYGTLGGTKPVGPLSYPALPATYPDTTGNVFAYLDGGGAGMGVCSGGLKSGAQCKTGSDDNVGIGGGGTSQTEILSFSLGDTFNLDQLLFRDEDHRADFYRDDTPKDPGDADGSGIVVGTTHGQVQAGEYDPRFVSVAIDGVDLDGAGGAGAGEFVQFALLDADKNALGAGLKDWVSIQLAKDTLVHLKGPDSLSTQFYLTGIDISVPGPGTTPIPLPAGVIFLLSGLLGLGAVGRFRKKVA